MMGQGCMGTEADRDCLVIHVSYTLFNLKTQAEASGFDGHRMH